MRFLSNYFMIIMNTKFVQKFGDHCAYYFILVTNIFYNWLGDVSSVRPRERPVRSLLQPFPAAAHGAVHLHRGKPTVNSHILDIFECLASVLVPELFPGSVS